MGHLQHDYDQKYLASASVRYDGSSNFGADNHFGLFYSGSLGWMLPGKLLMWMLWTIWNFTFPMVLQVAVLRISRYAPQGNVSYATYPGGLATNPSNLENPELKETTTTQNADWNWTCSTIALTGNRLLYPYDRGFAFSLYHWRMNLIPVHRR